MLSGTVRMYVLTQYILNTAVYSTERGVRSTPYIRRIAKFVMYYTAQYGRVCTYGVPHPGNGVCPYGSTPAERPSWPHTFSWSHRCPSTGSYLTAYTTEYSMRSSLHSSVCAPYGVPQGSELPGEDRCSAQCSPCFICAQMLVPEPVRVYIVLLIYSSSIVTESSSGSSDQVAER